MDKSMETPTSMPISQVTTHTTQAPSTEMNIANTTPSFVEHDIHRVDTVANIQSPANKLLQQAKEEGPSHTLELLAQGVSKAHQEAKNIEQKPSHEEIIDDNNAIDSKMIRRDTVENEESETIKEQKRFQDIWNDVFNEKIQQGQINIDDINREAIKRFDGYQIAHKLIKNPTEEVVENLTNSLQEGKFDLETFIKAAAYDTENTTPYMLNLQQRQKKLQEKRDRTPEEEEELKRVNVALTFYTLGYIEGKRNGKEEMDEKEKSLWELLLILLQQLLKEFTDFKQYTESGVSKPV